MNGDTLITIRDGAALATSADGSSLITDAHGAPCCCGDDGSAHPKVLWFRLVKCGNTRCAPQPLPPALWTPLPPDQQPRANGTYQVLLQCYRWDGASGADNKPDGAPMVTDYGDLPSLYIGDDLCRQQVCNQNYCQRWVTIVPCGTGGSPAYARVVFDPLSPPHRSFLVSPRDGSDDYCACISPAPPLDEPPRGARIVELREGFNGCCECMATRGNDCVTLGYGECCCSKPVSVIISGHFSQVVSVGPNPASDTWDIVGVSNLVAEGPCVRFTATMNQVYSDTGGIVRQTVFADIVFCCGSAKDSGSVPGQTIFPGSVTYRGGQVPFQGGPCILFPNAVSDPYGPWQGSGRESGNCYRYAASQEGDYGPGNHFAGTLSIALVFADGSPCVGCTDGNLPIMANTTGPCQGCNQAPSMPVEPL